MTTQHSIKRIYVKTMFDGVDYHKNIVLSIADGVITHIDNHVEDYDVVINSTVIPGFVDLQVNGGGGVLFNAEPSLSSLKTLISAHAQYGTTAMLPTIITDNIQTMQQAADTISLAIKNKEHAVLGIHFEGPHISSTKKGAHCKTHIRPITTQEWEIFERQDIGQILVTLAPECVSMADIKRLVSLGIIVSIGHSNASYELTVEAIAAGARGFTHLYNAMSQISGRAPGVTGAALLSDQTQCGVIMDGHHVSYASCQLALNAKPTGGIFLVTDAMPPVGVDIKAFDFFDRQVICENGKLTSSTGELAGSALTMNVAVKHCYEQLNVSKEEAIRMASLYPLCFLNNAHLPIAAQPLLEKNSVANFIEIDQDCTVHSTWVKGQCVYTSKQHTY